MSSDQMLQNLSQHKNPYVRAAIAEQGYALDTLEHDPDLFVRTKALYKKYKIDKIMEYGDDYAKSVASSLAKLLNSRDESVSIMAKNTILNLAQNY